MPRAAGPRVHKHTVLNKPRERGVRAPLLLISGNWLAAAGFGIGAKYTALSDEQGRITLHRLQAGPARAGTGRALMSHHRTRRSSVTWPFRFYVPRGRFHVPRAHLKVTARHLLLILRTVKVIAAHFYLQSRTVVLAPPSLSRAHAALKTVRRSRESAARSFRLAVRASGSYEVRA